VTDPILYCNKCKYFLVKGIATQQTYVGGMPDFAGDKHSSTFSAGGPGFVVECWKCPKCGYSVTSSTNQKEAANVSE
jgi:ribosomal protein L37AE/L43A